MSVVTTAKPLSWRELAGWCFGAALLLIPIVLVGVIVWMAYPPAQIYDLGPVDDFVTGEPNRRHVNTQDNQTVSLWIIRVEDRWLAFPGRMKVSASWNCEYRWVPINDRFEDPCSGFKWALTGELLTYFSKPPLQLQPGLRDLDQYAVQIEAGRVFVNLARLTTGVRRTEPPPNVTCADWATWPGGRLANCALK